MLESQARHKFGVRESKVVLEIKSGRKLKVVSSWDLLSKFVSQSLLEVFDYQDP